MTSDFDRQRSHDAPVAFKIAGNSRGPIKISNPPLSQMGQSNSQLIESPKMRGNIIPTIHTEKPLVLNEFSHEGPVFLGRSFNELKDLASNFLEAFRKWETSTENYKDKRNMEIPTEGPGKEILCMQPGVSTHPSKETGKKIRNPIHTVNKEHEDGNIESTHTDSNFQIQQIHEAEPVNIQPLNSQEETETEASNWVNTHILKLSNTYGVAFESFKKETLTLLMKIDERKVELDKKGQEKTETTSKNRGIGKNELKNLRSSLNEEVEGTRNRGGSLSLTYK